jgi:hypothetical protein
VTGKRDGEKLVTPMTLDAHGPRSRSTIRGRSQKTGTVTLVRVVKTAQVAFALKTVYDRQ